MEARENIGYSHVCECVVVTVNEYAYRIRLAVSDDVDTENIAVR